ncbi:hypothetical protein F7725_022443 [Dissostichus mawsoni]|uniref:Uncharacterized protein n=1 Tax=Dissostichus mawsoni TaxID=36200 RepID=A0A7J5Z263_DISMA|nr:hypothetical protein F7725_022443 [Dissostichus mawsoni]
MVGEDDKLTAKSKVDLARLPPCYDALKTARVNHRVALYKRADESILEKPNPYHEEQGWMRSDGVLRPRIDVCVNTGLATGHRTRHGETRGSGAAGRGSAGVGDTLDGVVGDRHNLLSGWVCSTTGQPASFPLQPVWEKGMERTGDGFASISARRAALLGGIVRSSRADVGGARKEAGQSLGDSTAEVTQGRGGIGMLR